MKPYAELTKEELLELKKSLKAEYKAMQNRTDHYILRGIYPLLIKLTFNHSA